MSPRRIGTYSRPARISGFLNGCTLVVQASKRLITPMRALTAASAGRVMTTSHPTRHVSAGLRRLGPTSRLGPTRMSLAVDARARTAKGSGVRRRAMANQPCGVTRRRHSEWLRKGPGSYNDRGGAGRSAASSRATERMRVVSSIGILGSSSRALMRARKFRLVRRFRKCAPRCSDRLIATTHKASSGLLSNKNLPPMCTAESRLAGCVLHASSRCGRQLR
jgi:hypothetical protein